MQAPPRVCKEPISPEEAPAINEGDSGTRFDPDVIRGVRAIREQLIAEAKKPVRREDSLTKCPSVLDIKVKYGIINKNEKRRKRHEPAVQAAWRQQEGIGPRSGRFEGGSPESRRRFPPERRPGVPDQCPGPAERPAAAPQNVRPARRWQTDSPTSGFSWGEDMPAEENQYSFNGDYLAYFDMVFSQEFPQYRITRDSPKKGHNTIYSFWQGERQVLIAELMSDRSEANKVRSACRERGIPYVRFYYDHDGWWNTRSYVTQRARAAMGQ